MLGIVLGTLCLIGLIGVMRRERYRRYGFAYGGGPWAYGHHRFHRHAHSHGPFGHAGHAGYSESGHGFGGHSGRRNTLNSVLAALETTPGQDRAIAQAFETYFERVRDAGKTREAAHAKIASAISGDVLDAHALQAGLAHEGEISSELRAELAASLSRVHEALDPSQRKLLAELIEEGLLARQFGRQL